jgi:hypothetical protein
MKFRALLNLNSTLDDLSEQSMLKKILWRVNVAGRVAAAYKELEEAVELFHVSLESRFVKAALILVIDFSWERNWTYINSKSSVRQHEMPIQKRCIQSSVPSKNQITKSLTWVVNPILDHIR